MLHVINQLWKSGAETSLRAILVHRSAHDLVYGLVVLSAEQNDLAAVQAAGVTTFVPTVTPRSRIGRIRHVRHAISAFRPHLVHTTLFEADLAGAVAGRLSGTPVLRSLVNMDAPSEELPGTPGARAKHAAVCALDRWIARHGATALHAITYAVAQQAIDVWKVEANRITVVPRGRALDRLGPATPERRARVRRSLGVHENQALLLAVGREEPQKGHRHLIEAMGFLRHEAPEARLVIVGRPGRASPQLDGLVAEPGLGERVARLGFREDIGDLLCAADLFVFPSLWEGLGGAVLEAMAMGVPIVASDIPALREVLAGGQCGVLVPAGSARDLATGIARTLANPEGRRLRAEAAATRFRTTYQMQPCIAGMEQLYADLARRSRHRIGTGQPGIT